MEYGINDWRNAIFESDLSPKARLVGLALAKYYRQGKECFPSYRTLWADTGYTNNHTIIEAINELKENGFIRIKKGQIKNLSIQSQAYEFVGVTGELTGELTGEVTGELTGELTGEVTGELTGELTGENNSPEIREEENKGIREDIKLHSPQSKLFAERLSEIVRKQKNIKIDNRKISSWAKSVDLLIHTDGVDEQRVDKALTWYSENVGGDYIPVIESGKTFREKFGKLESAIKRAEINKPQQTEDWGWL